ncbi:hypothetical protein J3R30DRAFT_3380037 [Lentinula aciculospora]|uniref:F-box domain-containing protein n=1 Tax=Lentinula aciculospora TaxID=153920 RepID=A0A9W9A303_9AGAR|nr:hypothetical protein J3R30DRAFT_3380037 [Lentinula aciculospora]
MSSSMLPLELMDAVCDNLAPADLARLSYTCSSAHQTAQRQLYRHVSISESRRNLSVVLTMAQKPHIAHYVRSFSIELDSHFTLLRRFYLQLSRALSGMAELTSLRLFVDPAASWVLRGISLPRLIYFACPFSLDMYVSDFLQHTSALLELEVDSAPFRHEQPTLVLPLSSVSHLQHFVGSSNAAEAIIPSRPVQSVQLTAGDFTEEVASRLAKSTAGIVILSATTSSAPAALLQLLSQKMQCLVHVRLLTTYSFPEAPDVAFYEHIAGALNAFPDLQTFELSGMHWGSEERKDSDRQRVWQSQPLKPEYNSGPEYLDIDPYSDLFFAY